MQPVCCMKARAPLPAALTRSKPQSPPPPLAAASARRRSWTQSDFVRVRRVRCAAQQLAAAGQPEGSAPVGSSSPTSAGGDGDDAPLSIDWARLEIWYWKVFSTVAVVSMLAMWYPIMTLLLPFVHIRHVVWGALTVYMLIRLIMFLRREAASFGLR
ncbi:hypothetical protein ABPG77_010128 [Micractinium sp. CCAP 211/92]